MTPTDIKTTKMRAPPMKAAGKKGLSSMQSDIQRIAFSKKSRFGFFLIEQSIEAYCGGLEENKGAIFRVRTSDDVKAEIMEGVAQKPQGCSAVGGAELGAKRAGRILSKDAIVFVAKKCPGHSPADVIPLKLRAGTRDDLIEEMSTLWTGFK